MPEVKVVCVATDLRPSPLAGSGLMGDPSCPVEPDHDYAGMRTGIDVMPWIRLE
jgi:hypothetical protein